MIDTNSNGLVNPSEYIGITDQMVVAKNLRDSGLTYAAIGQSLGVSSQTTRTWVIRYEVNFRRKRMFIRGIVYNRLRNIIPNQDRQSLRYISEVDLLTELSELGLLTVSHLRKSCHFTNVSLSHVRAAMDYYDLGDLGPDTEPRSPTYESVIAALTRMSGDKYDQVISEAANRRKTGGRP